MIKFSLIRTLALLSRVSDLVGRVGEIASKKDTSDFY